MKTPTLLIGLTLLLTSSFLGATTHVVKSGDNMYRIALAHKVSLTALQAANPGLNASSLSIGQQVNIPGSTTKAKTTTTTKAVAHPVATTGSYTIVAGDSLAKIARNNGISIAALQSANPKINANALQIGQRINLTGSGTAIAKQSAPATTKASTKPASVSQPVEQEKAPLANVSLPVEEHTVPMPVTEKSTTLSSVANAQASTEKIDVTTAVTGATLGNTPTQNIANQQSLTEKAEVTEKTAAINNYRLIKLTREQTLAAVATEYGSTPEKLIALNGWSISPQTLLAVDSELYVPAQP